MASELQTDYLTAKTVYFLLRNSVGQIWNGAAFEAYVTANYANYDIAGTEQGTASGYYVGNMPAVAAGIYYLVAKEQTGGSPAETDISIGAGEINWTGTVVPSLSTVTLSSGLSFLASGGTYIASGAFVNVPLGTLSGLVVNSGLFVTVPIATISGAVGNSGQFVTVPIATISGAIGNSGQFVTVPPASLSGVIANSGLFVTVPIATISGAIANSGLFVTLPKETISGVVANSGLFVVATATIASGSLYLASGSIFRETFASGVIAASGGLTTAWGNSGQVIPVSGLTQPASGAFVTVPIATISGVTANSGLFVTATATIASGQVWLASGSVILPSGGNVSLFSGQTVSIYSGTQVNVFSGSTYLASGSIFTTTFASGLLTAFLPDRILQRDFTASSGLIASGMSGRCLVNANRKLINKWDLLTSGFLTTFQEDDSSVAYRQAVTSASGAAPITSLDTD